MSTYTYLSSRVRAMISSSLSVYLVTRDIEEKSEGTLCDAYKKQHASVYLKT